MNQRKKLIAIGGVIGALWLALFFSNKGVLVWGDKPDDGKIGMLKCQYFTGTRIIEKQYLYSEQGFLGRQACPRTVDLGEAP